MISLVLPRPPSANRYWRPVRIGRGPAERITIVPTSEAKAYKTEIAWLCKAAGIRGPIGGRLEMRVQLYPHRPLDAEKRIRDLGAELWDDGVQCIDVGNVEKVLSDALEGVAYVNDSQLWRILLERMEPDGEERVVVSISAMPPRQTPQASLL